MMFRLIVAIFVLGSPFGYLGRIQAAEWKAAVVNVQDVLDTIDEGKKAKAQFEKFYLDRKGELEGKQKEYKRMEDSFEKQKLVLSPSALEEKKRELEVRREELQRHFMMAQTDTQKREMELTGDIVKKIRAIIEKMGREGGYDFIWEKNEAGLIYFKDSYDLTARVIGEYNKVYKK